MKARYKEKIIQKSDVEKAVQAEWDLKIDRLYEEVKKDVAAQLTAVFLIYLHQRYGWKGKVLNSIKTGVESLFKLMENEGIFGKEFTPINCIEYLQKLGVDIE